MQMIYLFAGLNSFRQILRICQLPQRGSPWQCGKVFLFARASLNEKDFPRPGEDVTQVTKRGVQGSEAGAVVSGMRTPLQGVKHTLGTTTRDRAAVRLHLEYHMPFYG